MRRAVAVQRDLHSTVASMPEKVYMLYRKRSGEAKHDIDFVAAQALWLDDNLLRIAARTAEE